MNIAQTNLQLYNQLRERGFSLEELVLVHRAYELLAGLYSGHYQADGKPFTAHGAGVASIVAHLGQPAEIVAAGLLHNVYGNGDFGDGRQRVRTPSRRRLVSEAVGERVEALLVRFSELRIGRRTIERIRRVLPDLDETDRGLVLIELADHLEKYVDLGVLYYGNNDWLIEADDALGAQLVEIAEELGEPRLAAMLRTAFEDAASQAPGVPAELRPSDGRQYLKLIVPRSCRRRMRPWLVELARRARSRARLGTRLDRLRARAGDGA